MITKRDFKVSFLTITIFACQLVLFNQDVDEAVAQRNTQMGQQPQTEMMATESLPFSPATKGDVIDMQNELKRYIHMNLEKAMMEISRQNSIICTNQKRDRNAEYEMSCNSIAHYEFQLMTQTQMTDYGKVFFLSLYCYKG